MSKVLKNKSPKAKKEGNPEEERLMTRQREILETLRHSPVFKMSLHSKELFHSNFLAWLGEDPELREVFRNVMESIGLSREFLKTWGDDYEILREKDHFDLLVKASDIKEEGKKMQPGQYYLVIENKIKSIPSKEQLEKYSEKLPKDNPELRKILLSIGKHDGELPDEWTQVTYSSIVEGLKKTVSDELSPYKKELIRDYTSMLECLVEIMSSVTVSPEETYLTDAKTNLLKGELDKLRISDLYDKWRASKIATLVSKKLGIPCYSGYTNKSPFIEVQLYLKGKMGDKDAIMGAIQIQGKQYRHCIGGALDSKELPDKFPGFLFDTKENFGKALQDEYPGVFDPAKMQNNYCCYGKDKENQNPFWYQYVIIKPGITIDTIIDCIRKDWKKLEGFEEKKSKTSAE